MKYLIANFGGPRNLQEIPTFLTALLTDQDVLRTRFPSWLHRIIFSRAARKRAVEITPDYQKIGGKSPIFEDTEAIAHSLSNIIQEEVLTFHRYLTATHDDFFHKISHIKKEEIRIFPMFPQFSYATTGSIARFFSKNLSKEITQRMRWIKSYPAHRNYILCMQQVIQQFLQDNKLKEEETILLFSAHGLPQSFIDTGEVYQTECEMSYQEIKQLFPKCFCKLSYQSKFGPGEWLRPYTDETCESISHWNPGKNHVVVIPLSFTTDHIETLFEIEHLYLPILREQGVKAFRCPALNLSKDWIASIKDILLSEQNLCSNQMLIA